MHSVNSEKKTHRKRVFNILTVCIFRKLSFFDFKMWKRIFGSEFVFDLPALEVPLCSFRGSLPHVNSQQQIQRQKGWQGSSDNDARAFLSSFQVPRSSSFFSWKLWTFRCFIFFEVSLMAFLGLGLMIITCGQVLRNVIVILGFTFPNCEEH